MTSRKRRSKQHWVKKKEKAREKRKRKNRNRTRGHFKLKTLRSYIWKLIDYVPTLYRFIKFIVSLFSDLE